MHPHYLNAIIVGLAVGGLIGYTQTSRIAAAFPGLYPRLIFVS